MPKCKDCLVRSAASYFLADDEFFKLETKSTKVDFKKGDAIIKQDAVSHNVVYLRTGIVKLHMKGPDRDRIMRIVKAPSYLGLPTCLGDYVNHFSVTGLSDCSVCFIDIEFFKSLIFSNGKFAYEIIVDLCKNELFDHTRFVNYEQKQVNGRIAETLLCMSDHLFYADVFQIPVSRSELADLVGTSRETISRTMSHFIQDQIIKTDGPTIEILDRQKLEKISQLG